MCAQTKKQLTEQRPFDDVSVAQTFAAYPDRQRPRMLLLRAQIFDVADATAGVGVLEERLRWGQPSYLTTASRSGSIVRVGVTQDACVVYFHCQTTLVATFRALYPDAFTYQGNRALVVAPRAPIPLQPLRHCIALALSYRISGLGSASACAQRSRGLGTDES